jgi:hypothetical protein
MNTIDNRNAHNSSKRKQKNAHTRITELNAKIKSTLPHDSPISKTPTPTPKDISSLVYYGLSKLILGYAITSRDDARGLIKGFLGIHTRHAQTVQINNRPKDPVFQTDVLTLASSLSFSKTTGALALTHAGPFLLMEVRQPTDLLL